jgi:hypothetical protein
MLTERLKTRLAKDRPVTSITLRIPVNVVESLKVIAPLRGLSGYQTLLKSYISEGLRRDEVLRRPPKNLSAAFDLLASLPEDVLAEGCNDAPPKLREGL